MMQNIIISLFLTFFSGISFLNAQTEQNQINQPAFLRSDEKIELIFNRKIYLVEKKENEHTVSINGSVYTTSSKNETAKIYFTDGQGNVSSVFKIFPSENVQAAFYELRNTKKYISIKRSYQDEGKRIMDGLLFDATGKILWNIPKEDLTSYMFPNDKNDSVMMIDAWKGFMKVYDVKGVEKFEKYFTDQNDQKFKDLATENLEDVSFDGACVSSEDGNYIAVGRNSADFKDFQSELTLLDSDGNIVFQNKAPGATVGQPLKIFESLNVIVVLGDLNDQSAGLHHRRIDTYFGIDFSGKKLWELEGQKYWLNPNDLRDVKDDLVRIDASDNTPTKLKLNIKTGEVN
jgi:hypothetical protein